MSASPPARARSLPDLAKTNLVLGVVDGHKLCTLYLQKESLKLQRSENDRGDFARPIKYSHRLHMRRFSSRCRPLYKLRWNVSAAIFDDTFPSGNSAINQPVDACCLSYVMALVIRHSETSFRARRLSSAACVFCAESVALPRCVRSESPLTSNGRATQLVIIDWRAPARPPAACAERPRVCARTHVNNKLILPALIDGTN